jgi:hypothetical protein
MALCFYYGAQGGILMNAAIFPENGEWLLVLNPTEQNHTAAEIANDPPTASAFERCWTGESWADTPSDGQRFDSKEHAATYLLDHWQRMENLAEALHDPIPPPTELPIRSL